jgi:deoxyribose-phosphate aldolase
MKQRFRARRKWYDSITLREEARPSPKQLFLHQDAALAGWRVDEEDFMAVNHVRRYTLAENLAARPEASLHASTEPVLATLSGRALHANHGIPLNLDWIKDVRVNTSAVERRAQTLVTRRTVKKEWQAAWLLRAITCIDLTTLQGDDTPGNVLRLCAKARAPLRRDLVQALDVESLGITVGAVCVYHALVPTAVRALEGSGIPVAAVSTGFPAGLNPFPQRLAEVRASVEAGADEIDIVITRAHVLTGDWPAQYEEVRAFREACGRAHMKAILATGELATLTNVARASLVAMMAGADFIKTSTGKEPVNATLPVGLVMTRMIREYLERTGHAVGFKPAGGIRSAKGALDWLILMKEELGLPWLHADRFRLGASSLLTDIERQLEYFVSGRYSAAHRHPMV